MVIFLINELVIGTNTVNSSFKSFANEYGIGRGTPDKIFGKLI
jgi:hypothetical protein